MNATFSSDVIFALFIEIIMKSLSTFINVSLLLYLFHRLKYLCHVCHKIFTNIVILYVSSTYILSFFKIWTELRVHVKSSRCAFPGVVVRKAAELPGVVARKSVEEDIWTYSIRFVDMRKKNWTPSDQKRKQRRRRMVEI